MHKLIEYICDELEELERKADKDGKLSMAEVQYMDTLAHAKKNLLKGDEMMDGEYSMAMDGSYRYDDGRSMARGRGRNARRDAMGRYSRRGSYSYAEGVEDMIDSIRGSMHDLPEDTKREAQKFIQKLEQAM
jgi:hypothetical protein